MKKKTDIIWDEDDHVIIDLTSEDFLQEGKYYAVVPANLIFEDCEENKVVLYNTLLGYAYDNYTKTGDLAEAIVAERLNNRETFTNEDIERLKELETIRQKFPYLKPYMAKSPRWLLNNVVLNDTRDFKIFEEFAQFLKANDIPIILDSSTKEEYWIRTDFDKEPFTAMTVWISIAKNLKFQIEYSFDYANQFNMNCEVFGWFDKRVDGPTHAIQFEVKAGTSGKDIALSILDGIEKILKNKEEYEYYGWRRES